MKILFLDWFNLLTFPAGAGASVFGSISENRCSFCPISLLIRNTLDNTSTIGNESTTEFVNFCTESFSTNAHLYEHFEIHITKRWKKTKE